MNTTETTHRFVCILNKKIPLGRAMNAIGHMSIGLGGTLPKEDLRLDNYVDADSTVHPSISDNPFIVLKADNSNYIRKIRQALIQENIPFTDFIDTMIEGTFKEQHERTRNTKEESLEYLGICFYMESDKARELTKKYSLYQ